MQQNSISLLVVALALSLAAPARATRPQSTTAGPRDEEVIREIMDLEKQAKDAAQVAAAQVGSHQGGFDQIHAREPGPHQAGAVELRFVQHSLG